MIDPHLPADHQHVDDDNCPHTSDYWFLDFESGSMLCRICDKDLCGEDEPADFSGSTEGDR